MTMNWRVETLLGRYNITVLLLDYYYYTKRVLFVYWIVFVVIMWVCFCKSLEKWKNSYLLRRNYPKFTEVQFTWNKSPTAPRQQTPRAMCWYEKKRVHIDLDLLSKRSDESVIVEWSFTQSIDRSIGLFVFSPTWTQEINRQFWFAKPSILSREHIEEERDVMIVFVIINNEMSSPNFRGESASTLF